MSYYKITPIADKSGCVYEGEKEFSEALMDWLDSLEVGEKLVVEKIDMTPQKFATLPEYEG